MAFGNNRAGKQSRAHFQLAGGTIIKFRHPYLVGQLSTTGNIDEVDISACCKLEGRYFEANPNQDSAKQVVLIDGSTVTITNKLLNGTITMPLIKTSGTVALGDFISCLHLIKSVGDTVGGLLYKTDFVNGKAITRVYYGVTPLRVPDDVSEGNDVGIYNTSLLYAGWIEVSSTSTDTNMKAIWATGTQSGVKAYFAPYSLQNADGKFEYAGSFLSGFEGIPSDSSSGDVEATVLKEGEQYVGTTTAVPKGTVNVQTYGGAGLSIPTA